MKAAIATLALVLIAQTAYAQICGDVDDNGTVTANDALAVLKTAVGLPIPLVCDTGDCLALETRMDALEDETLLAEDGDGNVLGRIVNADPDSTRKTVFVKSLGKTIGLGYVADEDATGFQPIGASYPVALYYSEPNCQGTPFVIPDGSVSDDTQIFYSFDARAFVATGKKAKPHLESSIIDTDGICKAQSADLTSLDNGNHSAFNLIEVALPFTLPAPGPFQIKPLR